MLPSDLTVFGLQKELLKCKQEARNLQGIKVNRKMFNPLTTLCPVKRSMLSVGVRRAVGSVASCAFAGALDSQCDTRKGFVGEKGDMLGKTPVFC